MYNKIKIKIEIKPIIIINFNSKSLIATILPNKKLLKLALFETKPDNKPATDTLKDIIIAIDISPYFEIFFLMYSIDKAAIIQKITEAKIGFILKTSPKVIPAREVCDIASPIIESLFKTITTPMHGIIIAKIIPTKKALLIKSN